MIEDDGHTNVDDDTKLTIWRYCEDEGEDIDITENSINIGEDGSFTIDDGDIVATRSESPALAGFQFLPLGVRPPCNTHGMMFKPELISVEDAVERGYYPDDFDDDDIARLEEIFPYGVADYEAPCMGMPEDIREALGLD